MHVSDHRAHRRWALATGAVLLIGGIGAGTAVAVSDHGPSPHAAREVEDGLPGDGVHLPGWRQELSAETVQCFVARDDGPPQLLIRTQASAEEQLREAELTPSVSVMDEGRACYRPVAYWDDAEVLVQALGPQPG